MYTYQILHQHWYLGTLNKVCQTSTYLHFYFCCISIGVYTYINIYLFITYCWRYETYFECCMADMPLNVYVLTKEFFPIMYYIYLLALLLSDTYTGKSSIIPKSTYVCKCLRLKSMCFYIF